MLRRRSNLSVVCHGPRPMLLLQSREGSNHLAKSHREPSRRVTSRRSSVSSVAPSFCTFLVPSNDQPTLPVDRAPVRACSDDWKCHTIILHTVPHSKRTPDIQPCRRSTRPSQVKPPSPRQRHTNLTNESCRITGMSQRERAAEPYPRKN